MPTVFDNPYIKKMGILPLNQGEQQQPMRGILSPVGLQNFGASLLAANNQPGANTWGAIGQSVLQAQGAVDQYNQRINKDAVRNASYNLQVANMASDADYRDRALNQNASYQNRNIGLEERKLGILEQQQASKDALNNQINSIIMGGGMLQEQPQAAAPYEDNQAQMSMMGQSIPKVGGILAEDTGRANTMMQLGAMTKNPSLVSYGKSLLDQQQNSPEFVANKKEAEKYGALRGEDKASFEGLATKMPELLNTVGELRDLADKATYTWVGTGLDALAKQGAGITTQGAAAETKYINKVNNQILPLLRDTFGSQFTATEGESLKATLGSKSMTPVEKQAALDAFIEQKIRDVQVGARRFGYEVPDYNLKQSYPASSTINWSDL